LSSSTLALLLKLEDLLTVEAEEDEDEEDPSVRALLLGGK
jgi:hypothetical protein